MIPDLKDEKPDTDWTWKIVAAGLAVMFFYVLYNSGAPNNPNVPRYQPPPPIPPRVTVNETIQLNEGSAKYYPLNLGVATRVRVQVNAGPRDVNVLLMTPLQLEQYQLASQQIGAQYQYTTSPLSDWNILNMDQTGVVPAGNWDIVVIRPHEAVFLRNATAAQVIVTLY